MLSHIKSYKTLFSIKCVESSRPPISDKELSKRKKLVEKHVSPDSAFFELYTSARPSLDSVLNISPDELRNAPDLSAALQAQAIMRHSRLQFLLRPDTSLVDRGIVSRIANRKGNAYQHTRFPSISFEVLADLAVGIGGLGLSFYDGRTGNLVLRRKNSDGVGRRQEVLEETYHFLSPTYEETPESLGTYLSGALLGYEKILRRKYRIAEGRVSVPKTHLTIENGTRMKRTLGRLSEAGFVPVFLINTPNQLELRVQRDHIWRHIRQSYAV